jgi:hypothetical protein
MVRHIKPGRLFWLVSLALLIAVGPFFDRLSQAQWCGNTAKQAAPQGRKGGESFPPLPLPATPLRRTEKKKPPSPPTLISKVQYGKWIWVTNDQGQRSQVPDWNTDREDVDKLLKWTENALGIRYKQMNCNLDKFSFNPAEISALYFTGHKEHEFTDEYRAKLHRYVMDGGSIIGSACCGAKPFTEGFMKEMAIIFPGRRMTLLADDHPLFDCFYQIGDVQYRDGNKLTQKRAPYILGMNVGCRTAVFLSPFDLCCGWDGHPNPGGEGLIIKDARELGANMITYCLANYQLGRFLASEKVYFQQGENTRDEFVFGQVKHDGDWDPCPSAVANLLKVAADNSTLSVQFKKQEVDLAKADALRHPLLYMTGHDDFKLSDAEVAGLRNYLKAGGVLLADSCCGRKGFALAFKREMQRVLPDKQFEAMDPNHPIFRSRVMITQVKYSDMMRQQMPGFQQPYLESITLNGAVAVIFSPYGLGTCWDGEARPYSLAYSRDDALRLGTNILVYSMTH